jgi:hypothetical protein
MKPRANLSTELTWALVCSFGSCVLLASCLEAPGEEPQLEAARVSAARPMALQTGVCGYLDKYDELGVLLDYVSDVAGNTPPGLMINAATSSCDAINEYVACRDSGLNELDCTGNGAAEGICSFLGNEGLNRVHPLAVFARHYAQVLDPYALNKEAPCSEPAEEAAAGESSLHCCRYTEEEAGCHTGFEAPSINCVIDYGPAGLNEIGLPTCLNHEECQYPVDDDEVTPADAVAPTLDELVRNLEHIWLKKVKDASDALHPVIGPYEDDEGALSACNFGALFRLGTFQGCKGWMDAVAEARPFAGELSEWVVDGHLIDETAANQVFVRMLANYAAARTVLGIPNGTERLQMAITVAFANYASTSDAYIAELEASRGIHLDAEAELLKWLSPCALEVLKAIPTLTQGWWRMMAYPKTTETPTTLDPALYEDACVVGGRPSIVSVDVQKGSSKWNRTLRIEASDPESTGWTYAQRTALAYELVSGGFAVDKFDWQRDAATSVDTFSYPWDNVQASTIPDVVLINSAGNGAIRNERTIPYHDDLPDSWIAGGAGGSSGGNPPWAAPIAGKNP